MMICFEAQTYNEVTKRAAAGAGARPMGQPPAMNNSAPQYQAPNQFQAPPPPNPYQAPPPPNPYQAPPPPNPYQVHPTGQF